MEEHQRQRKQTIVDLTYCEQRVQEGFERLLVLYSSEKNKADFFLTKAWESYWHRMELIDWLSRMNKGLKKERLPDPSNVSLATGIYLSAVRCLVPYLVLSCLVLSWLF